jgi:hypothetical protein
MKTNEKLNTLLGVFNEVIRISTPDKNLSDIINHLKRMTADFVGQVVSRKKELKAENFDTIEALRQQIKSLEGDLFTQKIEAESLKIDRKYFEDQMKELQRINDEMRVNIDSLKSGHQSRTTSKIAEASQRSQFISS